METPEPLGVLTRRLTGILADRSGRQPVDAHADELAPDLTTEEGRATRAVQSTDARIPARYRDANPDDPAVMEWAATYEPSSGRSLLLLGPTGVGKTHQAYGALRLVAARGIGVAWQAMSAADLYARLRPRHGVDSEAEFRTIVGAPLLLVDDFGVAKQSEWVEEITYRLVNTRYEAMSPTLFTSNVPPAELGSVLGDRVASRLVEMTDRVVLKGKDRRRAA